MIHLALTILAAGFLCLVGIVALAFVINLGAVVLMPFMYAFAKVLDVLNRD